MNTFSTNFTIKGIAIGSQIQEDLDSNTLIYERRWNLEVNEYGEKERHSW